MRKLNYSICTESQHILKRLSLQRQIVQVETQRLAEIIAEYQRCLR